MGDFFEHFSNQGFFDSLVGRENIDVRSKQGYKIGKLSLLLLTVEQRGKNIDIFVGGKSMIMAQGEFINFCQGDLCGT